MGRIVFKFVATILGLLIMWELLCWLIGVRSYLLPPPSMVFRSGWEYRQALSTDFLYTLVESVCGFVLALFIGLLLASLTFIINSTRRPIIVVAVSLKSVPIVICAPIFLLWFGYGMTAKLLLAAVVALFPILVAGVEGISSASQAEHDLFRAFGATRWQLFRKLIVPRSVPMLIAGMRISAPSAVLGSLIAETAGARHGLGVTMTIASANLNSGLVFAAAMLAAALGLLAFTSVAGIEWCLRKYTS
ncbi:MAG: ABC transporter permease subunit [Planctomycetia bacterium]|nr:ABC transporter permease subunit [Planctomycetia bacterium]